MPPQSATAIPRFWARVNKTETCWLWTGCENGSGYGAVRWEGKTDRAHRVAWNIEKGPTPPGACVLHRCDVRLCVRPDHLFLGSRADNAHDRTAKGRRGEVHGRLLTSEKVAEIRRRHAEGERADDLAAEHGVTQWTVFDLLSRRTWKATP